MSKVVKIACRGAMSVPYTKLVPFQGALKDLTEESYERLKKEIVTRGFSFAPHVWKGPNGKLYILDGHQRVRALGQMVEKEGFSCPSIPVVPVQAKSIKEAKLKVLAGTSQYGEMQKQGLYEFMHEAKISMKELEDSFQFPEIDLEAFKYEFFKDEIPPEETDSSRDDAVPTIKKINRTKKGDVYLLGKHRLLCGDSTDIAQINKLLDNEKADMVFTDPPYGVDYDGGTTKREKIANDHDETIYEKVLPLLYDVTHDHAAFFIWYAQSFSAAISAALEAARLVDRKCIIWNKNMAQFGALSAQYKDKYEPVFYCFKKGHKPQWFGPTNEVSVWDCKRASKNEYHPTQKPVELAERAMMNHTKPGQSVLDLFGGSGATLIACEKNQRKCYMMELDTHYCDVILERWAIYTGQEPIREADKMPWSQIKALKDKKTKLRKGGKPSAVHAT